ncbi:MAG: GAF domain-containing protein [Acidobacteriota bacterium]|nr:MAG: GAF domain-containing protein [Acidobacteriota bacterium]
MGGGPTDKVLEAIRKVVETVEVAEVLTTPFNESIENLLELSSRSIKAEGASVLIPEGAEGDLVFKWACGSVSDSLIGVKIPSGKGIAGFVFTTGQPMAVSDAERETNFYSEIDRNTGFSTHTILATPLHFDGDVIGVLEYVNRDGDPPFEPFTPEEMDLAAHYADAVASLVRAYKSADVLGEFSRRILESADGEGSQDVEAFFAGLEASAGHKDRIRLAELVRRASSLGEKERALCEEILASFVRYGNGGSA